MGCEEDEVDRALAELDMAHFVAELLWTVDAAASDFMRDILLDREMWPEYPLMEMVADIMDNS
jgi:hypothetical protein